MRLSLTFCATAHASWARITPTIHSRDYVPYATRELYLKISYHFWEFTKENCNSQAACIKIIRTHLRGISIYTQIFSDVELHVLPTAISWIGQDGGSDVCLHLSEACHSWQNKKQEETEENGRLSFVEWFSSLRLFSVKHVLVLLRAVSTVIEHHSNWWDTEIILLKISVLELHHFTHITMDRPRRFITSGSKRVEGDVRPLIAIGNLPLMLFRVKCSYGMELANSLVSKDT